MYEFRFLLDRFWVTRAENKDLYFAVKRALPHYRRLVNEQLGWNLIVNESVIKLEKVPPKAMVWMGIQEFQEKLDYCLLCGMLLFLSDLDDGEQFLLSSLTEALEAILAEVQPVDWTRFPHRKALVRVLQYAQRTGMLLAYDGVSEGFGNDQTQEVLYENTGLSRHFPVHFGRDIMKCRSIEDFEAFSWEGEEAERGRQRIQRVYRQLTLALDALDDLPRVLALDRDGDHLRPLVVAGQRVLFPLGAQVDDRLYSQVVQPDGIPFAQVADLAGTEDLSPFGGLAFRVRVTAQVADILHAVHHDGARAHDMPVLPVEVEAEVFPVEIVVRDVGRYAILDIDIFGGRPVETGRIVGDRDADRSLHTGSDFPFQDIIPDLVPLAIGMNGGLVG